MKQQSNEKREMVHITLDMAWPAILESFFSAFTGLVDSLMVSSLGTAAVASVGLTTQPKFIGLSLFFATNVAISALVARRRGEQRKSDANRLVSTMMLFVIIASILISIATVIWADPLIALCGSNEDTHAGAVAYFRIVMGGMIFNCISMGINSAQRGAGNTKITMRTNVTSNIINVIFNWLLIEGHLGFPALGIEGAALATVLGTVVACIMSIISITKPDGFICLRYIRSEKLRPALSSMKNIIKVGYSVFFEQILMRVGFMATAIMAAKQGTQAMAAHQVGMNLMGLSFSFGDGLQSTAVALIGRSLGEKNKQKAIDYGSICKRFGAIIAVLMVAVYLFGARFLMGLFFPSEPDTIEIGVSIMRIIALVIIFQISQVILMGCLRGAGDTLYTAIASMISVVIIRTVFSYLGGYTLGWGIVGIWLGVLFDQVSRYIFAVIRYKKGKWTEIQI